MKNVKKLIAMMLVLVLCMSMLSACGSKEKEDTSSDTATSEETTDDAAADDASAETTEETTEETSALPAMTTEPITLTYCSWENEVLTDYLVKKFQEKYPNITVETTYYGTDVYNDSLLNLVNAGQTPDAFWILGECDFAIQNELLGDMTQYWENDPENQNILTTINDFKFGYYGTDKKYATPVKYLPDAIFANMTVFDQLNVEMPSTEWTWEEFIQSVKDMTVPEQGIYGYNDYRTIITWYPVAADSEVCGEFGWDGTKFDMKNWADGLNLQAELRNGGNHAPLFDTDEAEAVFGDRTMWAAYSGKIAYQFDAW
ncbi:MAG TPA: extracellular solute-binding protein, partial [Lachnospiraceae bacterium]|nr:extracellular solute-binding protein [Lachnospiraceae bacterium]